MSTKTKVAYLILFIGLILEPHIITGHIFGVPEAFAESIGVLVLFLAGYLVYYLHSREIKHKEQEVQDLQHDLDISSQKLIDSFEYIGHVNRKLPLIGKLTTDLLERTPIHKKDKKNIFTDLLATATISTAKADWGMFRIIDTESEKTGKEFIMASKQYALLKTNISNKELLESNGTKKKVIEIGDLYVFRASDQKSKEQCFLIFPKPKEALNNEVSLLQNITDQAQLFYRYLYGG